MSFFFKDGRKDGRENKTYDPYREEDLGLIPGSYDGSRIVKKTYDPTYDWAYKQGQNERAMDQAIQALNDRPLYFPSKPTCPHCGKEL